MGERFTSFVVFAEMRTGSNHLEANLNAIPGIACLGEMFNPHFIGSQGRNAMFGTDLAERERDPHRLLRRLRRQTRGLAGFRYFHDHDARILPALLDDAGCAKIILTRNPLESYVSLGIAQATGQWKLTHVRNRRTARAVFDAEDFARHVEAIAGFQTRLLHELQRRGQTAFYIGYEDLQDLDVLNGLAAWLGVEGRLSAIDRTLTRQNPEPLADKVTNPDEMRLALAGMDPFALGQTPNLEPRRGPALPGYLAARGAPFLFLPVPAAPDATVRDWLSSLGGGGLTGGFNKASLHQWMRANPGHRSFTVVRHPLLRAHVAFGESILRNRAPAHRATLARMFDLELPSPGEPFPEPEAHRAAFLAFLHHVRLSLDGQTAQRPDPGWASQTAILQGFASFHPPSLVLREDNLAAGLAGLAAAAGVPAPAFTMPDDAAARSLDTIHTPGLEEACREAYDRDYLGFGFDDWRGGGSRGPG